MSAARKRGIRRSRRPTTGTRKKASAAPIAKTKSAEADATRTRTVTIPARSATTKARLGAPIPRKPRGAVAGPADGASLTASLACGRR